MKLEAGSNKRKHNLKKMNVHAFRMLLFETFPLDLLKGVPKLQFTNVHTLKS